MMAGLGWSRHTLLQALGLLPRLDESFVEVLRRLPLPFAGLVFERLTGSVAKKLFGMQKVVDVAWLRGNLEETLTNFACPMASLPFNLWLALS
jgi:hypothetical protein